MIRPITFAPSGVLDLVASGLKECTDPACQIASEPKRRHAHSARGREALCDGGFAYPARSTTYLDLASEPDQQERPT